MEATTRGMELKRNAIIALGAAIALGTSIAALLTIGFDFSPMLLYSGAPTPVPPSQNPVPSGYWWEFSNTDPLVTGLDIILGAFPRTSYA